VAPILAVAEH